MYRRVAVVREVAHVDLFHKKRQSDVSPRNPPTPPPPPTLETSATIIDIYI